MEQQKETFKIFGPRTLRMKKPFWLLSRTPQKPFDILSRTKITVFLMLKMILLLKNYR